MVNERGTTKPHNSFQLNMRRPLPNVCASVCATLRLTRPERTYNRRRRQARLGRLTPVEFEALINTAATAAQPQLSPTVQQSRVLTICH